jgi:hypothetical protein
MGMPSSNEITPDLTIPEFEVKVINAHCCQVISKDGRYEFSVEIAGQHIRISGPMFPKPLESRVGPWIWYVNWEEAYEVITDVDDLIAHVAKSLRLLDKFSSDGFSAKIEGKELVLSHSSKPNYSLHMRLTNIRKLKSPFSIYTSVYTPVVYCGPAYAEEANTKWNVKRGTISNYRLIASDKDIRELSQELKKRVLGLGEPDSRIVQWVSQEIEQELVPQGFTFTPKPEKALVEFSHPTGLSGSFSFALFTGGCNFDIHPKFPNQHFPTDIEQEKVVLFTCTSPDIQTPYTKTWLANKPNEAINEIRGVLACALVHQEVCKEWKSDILIPKWNGNRLQLVNTKLEGDNAIILELASDEKRLLLKGMGDELSCPILNTPIVVDAKKITQAIVNQANRHVQEFIQANGITTKVIEVEL